MAIDEKKEPRSETIPSPTLNNDGASADIPRGTIEDSVGGKKQSDLDRLKEYILNQNNRPEQKIKFINKFVSADQTKVNDKDVNNLGEFISRIQSAKGGHKFDKLSDAFFDALQSEQSKNKRSNVPHQAITPHRDSVPLYIDELSKLSLNGFIVDTRDKERAAVLVDRIFGKDYGATTEQLQGVEKLIRDTKNKDLIKTLDETLDKETQKQPTTVALATHLDIIQGLADQKNEEPAPAKIGGFTEKNPRSATHKELRKEIAKAFNDRYTSKEDLRAIAGVIDGIQDPKVQKDLKRTFNQAREESGSKRDVGKFEGVDRKKQKPEEATPVGMTLDQGVKTAATFGKLGGVATILIGAVTTLVFPPVGIALMALGAAELAASKVAEKTGASMIKGLGDLTGITGLVDLIKNGDEAFKPSPAGGRGGSGRGGRG